MHRNKKTGLIALPAGTYDILPDDQKYWRHVFKKTEALLDDYGFERIDTPVIEVKELFYRTAVQNPESVRTQLYDFKSRTGEDLAIRSDLAIPAVRAYLQHGMQTLSHPIKMMYMGFVLRDGTSGDRHSYKIGTQTIGDDSEVVDAELLFLADKILKSMGAGPYVVHINTIGDGACRPQYVRALRDYYKPRLKKICADCKNNFKINPMMLLQCVQEECKQTATEAPQIMDFLDEGCRTHFKRILEFMDLAQMPYMINPFLIRTEEYASRTVFEFWPEETPVAPGLGEAIVSGGRNDKLVDMLGGHKMPAVGLTMDVTRAVNLLKEKNISVPSAGTRPKVFLAHLGDVAKRKSLLLFEEIRKAGVEIRFSLSRDSIKSQIRIAGRLGVRFMLIFGQKEAIEKTVILREMETGIQETIPLEKIIDELKKRLKK